MKCRFFNNRGRYMNSCRLWYIIFSSSPIERTTATLITMCKRLVQAADQLKGVKRQYNNTYYKHSKSLFTKEKMYNKDFRIVKRRSSIQSNTIFGSCTHNVRVTSLYVYTADLWCMALYYIIRYPTISYKRIVK